jgi:hypothetical protein
LFLVTNDVTAQTSADLNAALAHKETAVAAIKARGGTSRTQLHP